jgi:hypothetical protein
MRPGYGLYALFLGRLEELRLQPAPPDWDGVTTFEEK